MPIFIVRQAPIPPTSRRPLPPSTWRWVATVDARTSDEALELAAGLGRPLLTDADGWGISLLVATSLPSWLIEYEDRRRRAKTLLARGEDPRYLPPTDPSPTTEDR